MRRENYWSVIQHFTHSNLLATQCEVELFLIVQICDCSSSEEVKTFFHLVVATHNGWFFLTASLSRNFTAWSRKCKITLECYIHTYGECCIFSATSINRTTIIKALACSNNRIFRIIGFQIKTTNRWVKLFIKKIYRYISYIKNYRNPQMFG
jgi:hypothetical protein